MTSYAAIETGSGARKNGVAATDPPGRNYWRLGLPCLLGAMLNILGFGFQYGLGNHYFELAMLNWLRDSTLYPEDPLRQAFIRFPTVFWRAVALVPGRMSTSFVLFVLFLGTKIIFFYGLTKLARCINRETSFLLWVAVLAALTPVLNIRTPFGYAQVLDPIQTQTPLAIALLVYAGAELVEGNWIRSAVVSAACIYLNVIYVVFMLFAFCALAVTDFRDQKKRVLCSALAGAAVLSPWLIWNRALFNTKYPAEYLPALLLFYPRHLVFSSHNVIDLFYGPGFLCIALATLILAHRRGISLNWRVEIMACSFAVPVAMGVIAGEYHLTPLLASLQLMRADSFLFLYLVLLLVASIHQLAARAMIPYSKGIATIAAVFFVWPATPVRFLLLLLGFGLAGGLHRLGMINSARVCLNHERMFGKRAKWGLQAAYFIGISVLIGGAIGIDIGTPGTFVLSSNVGGWLDLQTWARLNTPPGSVFLVPPGQEGFRVNSQRSSWGEWKDGMAVYLYPQFAATYIKRMAELGVHEAPMQPGGQDSLREIYKRQSHDHLLAIARENHLQYIVQYNETKPNARPLYSNPAFAVYRVP